MSILANYPVVRPSIDLDFANGQQLDPRISYGRSTTASYYNGVSTATAEQNFLPYSQTFQNAAWTAVGLTVLDNQTLSPDGVNSTAASLTTGSIASNTHSIVATAYLSGNINNGQTTISFYVKAGTSNFITISSYGGTSNWYAASTFNLSTGTITQNATATGSPIVFANSSILSVGNGWYRCSVTTTNIANNYNPTRAYIQINSSATPTLGTSGLETWASVGTESIYVWGGQYENRTFPGTYQVTTTALVNNNVPQLLTAPINQPRFDFNPTTGVSLGLLLEGVTTNLLKYSADLTQSNWTQSNCSISSGYPNNNVSPDGTFSGQFIQENSATSTHYVSQSITKAASGLQYTFSVYAKAGTRTNNWLQISDGAGNGTIVYFDLNAGSISTAAANTGTWGTLPTTPASITSVGNGWYRCCLTSFTTSATTLVVQHGLSTNGSTNSYAGNGANGIYSWGAQLEQTLGYQTSYIPTLASQVTRSADITSITPSIFSTVFNIQQGTIYSKITAIYGAGNIGPEYYDIYGNNGLGGDSIRAGWIGAWGGVTFALNQGNPYLGSGIATPTVGTLNTIQTALSYAQTGYIASSNGSTAQTSSTNGSRTGNGTEVLILNGNSGAIPSVWFSKFAIYPLASSATQVQAITGS